MSEIRPEHIEWAFVHRLLRLLDPPDEEFNVTQAYGLLVPIVCWVMQRIRAGDRIQGRMADTLRGERIFDPPWDVNASNISKFQTDIRLEKPSISAFDFLIGLRNGLAHGDGRGVKPLHTGPDRNGRHQLVGVRLRCEATENHRVIWKGTVDLYEPDMRRIAKELAMRFCSELRARKPEDPRFEVNVGRYVMEHA